MREVTAPSLRSYRRNLVRFVVTFCVLAAAASGLETWMRARRIGVGYQRAVAVAATRVAGVVGVGASLQARSGMPIIEAGGMRLAVTIECAAILPTGLFIAAVLATPCSRRARILGVLLGVVGVALLNILRIVILIAAARHRADWFGALHDVLMQGFLLILVAPLWTLWLYRAAGDLEGERRSRPNRTGQRGVVDGA